MHSKKTYMAESACEHDLQHFSMFRTETMMNYDDMSIMSIMYAAIQL